MGWEYSAEVVSDLPESMDIEADVMRNFRDSSKSKLALVLKFRYHSLSTLLYGVLRLFEHSRIEIVFILYR